MMEICTIIYTAVDLKGTILKPLAQGVADKLRSLRRHGGDGRVRSPQVDSENHGGTPLYSTDTIVNRGVRHAKGRG